MATSELPVPTSARLTYHVPSLADATDYFALRADPEVMRFVGGRPQNREEAWLRLLTAIGHFAALGFGVWVLRERGSGRFVGVAGLFDSKRELTPPQAGLEAGWMLATWAHGRGLATEAMRAALDFGDRHLPPGRIFCIIDPGHAASLRVAAKLGFVELLRTVHAELPTVVLERRPTP